MGTTTRELRVESWVEYFDAIASGNDARSAAILVKDASGARTRIGIFDRPTSRPGRRARDGARATRRPT